MHETLQKFTLKSELAFGKVPNAPTHAHTPCFSLPLSICPPPLPRAISRALYPPGDRRSYRRSESCSSTASTTAGWRAGTGPDRARRVPAAMRGSSTGRGGPGHPLVSIWTWPEYEIWGGGAANLYPSGFTSPFSN